MRDLFSSVLHHPAWMRQGNDGFEESMFCIQLLEYFEVGAFAKAKTGIAV